MQQRSEALIYPRAKGRSAKRRFRDVLTVLIVTTSLGLTLQLPFAMAIDPATVTGTLQVDDKKIALTHACAIGRDNAEGLLDSEQELRILLTDREVPHDALSGIMMLPVEDMARLGKVSGLLIKMDPANTGVATVSVLTAPADPSQPLIIQTLSTSEGSALERLEIGDNRVVGAIDESEEKEPFFEDVPKVTYSAEFSAPIFHEPPVTADLKGKDALESPQIAVFRARVAALAKGDFEAIRSLSTERANARNEMMMTQMGADAIASMRQAAPEMEKAIATVQRVVVREKRAVVIFPDKQWMNFELVDGVWKADD